MPVFYQQERMTADHKKRKSRMSKLQIKRKAEERQNSRLSLMDLDSDEPKSYDNPVVINEANEEEVSLSSSKLLNEDEISTIPDSQVKLEAKHQTEEQFGELLENDLFVDYFNKYLSLPVFGQVAFYDQSECRFRIYPDVNSTSWRIDYDRVLDWLYNYRFLRFNTSTIYTEYLLCKALCEAEYFQNGDELVQNALKFLQITFLRGVSKMKNFRQFLQALPASTTRVGSDGDCEVNGQNLKYNTGYIIYNFWLDAQRFQATIESNSTMWYQLMVEIRDKYSHYASSLQLPKHLLEHECLKVWDSQAIVTAAKVFLEHLKYYWVPRYLLTIKEDGLKGSDIALFSLAKKHLHVTQPSFYPHIVRPENQSKDRRKSRSSNQDMDKSKSKRRKSKQSKVIMTSSITDKESRDLSSQRSETNWHRLRKQVRPSKAVTMQPIFIGRGNDQWGNNSLEELADDCGEVEVGLNENLLTSDFRSSKREKKASFDSNAVSTRANSAKSNKSNFSAFSGKSLPMADFESRRTSIIVDDRSNLGEWSSEEDESDSLDSNQSNWSFDSNSSFTSLLGSLVDSEEERERKSSSKPARPSINQKPARVSGPRPSLTITPSEDIVPLSQKPLTADQRKQSFETVSIHSEKTDRESLVVPPSIAPSRHSCRSASSAGIGTGGRRRSIMKYKVNPNTFAPIKELREDVSEFSQSVRSSLKGSVKGALHRRKSSVNSQFRNSQNNQKPAKLKVHHPASFAPLPVEEFLRNYVSTVGVLDRAAMQKSAIATNIEDKKNKVEIMKSSISQAKTNTATSTVKVKGSRHTKSQMSANKFSRMSIASNASARTQDSQETEDEEDSGVFQGVTSTKKKRKRVRAEQQTFAFSIGEILKNAAANSQEDNDSTSTEHTNDAKSQRSSNSSGVNEKNQKEMGGVKQRKRSSAIAGGLLNLELTKESRDRAHKVEMANNKLKWEKQQQELKRRASKERSESLKRKSLDKQLKQKRKSTVADDKSMKQMFAFQEVLLEKNTNENADKEWREENQMVIQAFQSDEIAAFPFRQWLYEEGSFMQLQILSVWIDIERLRSQTQFGSEIRSHEQFTTFFKKLVQTCCDDSNDISNYVSPIIKELLSKIDASKIFDIPKPFIQLQRDLFDELISHFRDFAKVETRRFKKWSCTEVKRRVTFCYDEIDYDSSDEDEFELKNYHPSLKNRMARAVALSLDIKHIHKYQKFMKSEQCAGNSSDDNGEVSQRVVQPIYWNKKPEMSAVELYNNAKHEYPAPGYKGHKQNTDFENDFKRPLRKNGNLIHRPTARPKSLKEILKHSIHFEFFRRYLRCHKVDRMLLFWRAIEQMKNTHNTKQRQLKAQSIMEKFFHDPEKSACEILCCNAPIIHEIPGLEVVTTSMLFSAQNTILHQIDIDWFGSYVETFPKVEIMPVQLQITKKAEQEKQNSSAITKGLRAALRAHDPTLFNDEEQRGGKKNRQKLFSDRKSIVRVWVALCDWFCAAAKFIRCMDRRSEYNRFYGFLQMIGDNGINNTLTDANGNMVNSNTDIKDRPAKQIICGQLVTLKNLQNDLDFWMEADAFKNLFTSKTGEVSTSDTCYQFYSESLILQKADCIKACFLEQRGREAYLMDNGAVVTDSYINVPRDLCDATIMSINSGIIDNTIFMEASGYVFPILVHFWKIYREQYAKVTYSKWMKLTDVLRARLKIERRRKAGLINKAKLREMDEIDAVPIPELRFERIERPLSMGSGIKLPIVVSEIRNIKPLTPVPFSRIKRNDANSARTVNSATGGNGDYETPGTRISFSLQEGIVLHCAQRWQDTIPINTKRAIKHPSNITSVSDKHGSSDKNKKGFKIVIEDDDSTGDLKNKPSKDAQNKSKKQTSKATKQDRTNDSTTIDSKKSKNKKSTKQPSTDNSHTSFYSNISNLSSVSDSKLTNEQRTKRVLRRREQEAEKAFQVAEKKLRQAIRAQVREKRLVNSYPKYH